MQSQTSGTSWSGYDGTPYASVRKTHQALHDRIDKLPLQETLFAFRVVEIVTDSWRLTLPYVIPATSLDRTKKARNCPRQ